MAEAASSWQLSGQGDTILIIALWWAALFVVAGLWNWRRK